MPGHKCFAVPPYLLKAIADYQKQHDDGTYYDQCIEHQHEIHAKRTSRFDFLCKPIGERRDIIRAAAAAGTTAAAGHSDPGQPSSARKEAIPPYLLQAIASSDAVDDEARANAKKTLEHIAVVHQQRVMQMEEQRPAEPKTEFHRVVYDAKNSGNEEDLPGTKVRAEGDEAIKDEAVNDAYDNCGKVLDFYEKIFNWKSIDNKNMPIISTVHFGHKYGNAFWDPDRQQMVYGDGDNFLHNFTKCLDVIGHEMTHAVTEYTSPLDYQGQPGALNEHISDVFGIMAKQKFEDETADKADWLIGEGCLLPNVKGVALRNMAKPGTAYDDEILGKDPQPENFKDYVPMFEDNGGVHIYSGIPNRAFYLSAIAFGGYSWEKAGRIWWKTMQSQRIPPRSTFKQFAQVTIDIAEEEYGAEGEKIVREAWETVGVMKKST